MGEQRVSSACRIKLPASIRVCRYGTVEGMDLEEHEVHSFSHIQSLVSRIASSPLELPVVAPHACRSLTTTGMAETASMSVTGETAEEPQDCF